MLFEGGTDLPQPVRDKAVKKRKLGKLARLMGTWLMRGAERLLEC